jgi:hypothetical protein
MYDVIRETPATIRSAIVLAVDPERGVCTVKTNDITGRLYKDIPYSTGYLSPNGGGIDICPERNSQCWVMSRSSDAMSPNDGEASIIAFKTPRIKDQYLNKRIKLLPGDLRFSTSGGNEFMLRKNGDVYIFSGAACSLSLVSSEELVKMVSPSFEHNFGAGNVSWQVNSSIAGGPTSCSFGLKRNSSDSLPYLQMLAGESMGGGLNVSMYVDGEQSSIQFELDVSNEGVCAMFIRKSLTVSTEDSINLTSRVINVAGSESVSISASQSSVVATSNKLTLTADVVEICAKQFIINDYGANVLTTASDGSSTVLSSNLFDLLKNHSHTSLGTPSETLSVLSVDPYSTKSKLI